MPRAIGSKKKGMPNIRHANRQVHSASFSLLDDFDSGNTTLDDIIQIPTDCKRQKLNPTGFDFNKYLIQLALSKSDVSYPTSSDNEDTTQRLDFGKGKKTTIRDDDFSEIEIGRSAERSKDEEDQENEPVAADLGQEAHDIILNNSNSKENSRLAMDDLFDKAGEDDDDFFEDLDFDLDREECLPAHSSTPEKKENSKHHNDVHKVHEPKKVPTVKPIKLIDTKKEDIPLKHRHIEYDTEEALDDHRRFTQDISLNSEEEVLTTMSPHGSSYKDMEPPQVYADDSYMRLIRKKIQTKSPGRICSPSHRVRENPLKSNIRVRKNLLNLIVESSDGSLDDATKYATEINSQNSSGIPLPEKTTELVTIPTTGPSVGGVRKAAIVRAMLAKAHVESMTHGGNHNIKHISQKRTPSGKGILKSVRFQSSRLNTVIHSSSKKHVGFYTATEKDEFAEQKKKKRLEEDNEKAIEKTKEKIKENVIGDKENQQPIASKIQAKTRDLQTMASHIPLARRRKSHKVKWASRLEW